MVVIKLINPRFVIVGNGLTIEDPIDNIMNIFQINDNLRKALLQRSIICDEIIIDKKSKTMYDILSAEDLVEDSK
jgi:hypothetical protein